MDIAPRIVRSLKITDGSGDTVAVYAEGDLLTDAEVDIRFDAIVTVEEARARFDEAKAKGFLAYVVPADDPAGGSVIREFDETAEQIVMSPQLVGG